MLIRKVVFNFSLLLMVGARVAHADFTSLDRKVHQTNDLAAAIEALKGDTVAMQDKRLQELTGPLKKAEVYDDKEEAESKRLTQIRDALDLRARLEGQAGSTDSVAVAQRIKGNRLYSDPSEKKQSNWLSDAWDDFTNLFRYKINPPKMPDVQPPTIFGPWIKVVMYAILAAALLVFAWFALGYFRFTRGLRRKASALMEDDEPERTLDEWLAMAAQLEAEGKYREAVRCLYLACLLRFDESGVARFVKGQTNWEHLHRIRSSPKLPEGLEFGEPTKAFDRIWYGFKGNGQPDVDTFRNWYQITTQALQGVHA